MPSKEVWFSKSKRSHLFELFKSSINNDNIEIEPSFVFSFIFFSLGLKFKKKNEIEDKLSEKEYELKLIANNLGKSLNELNKAIDVCLNSPNYDIICQEIIKIYQENIEICEEIEALKRILDENILITPESFKNRIENSSIRESEFEIFIGRRKEIKKLKDFLNLDNTPVCILSGAGGTGKTRLVMEYAEEIQENWDVFFIDSYKPYKKFEISRNTVVILDETPRYKKIDALINSVVNRENDEFTLKLILIMRPLFVNEYRNKLDKFYSSGFDLYLKPGEIFYSLRKNFELDVKTAKSIANNSQGNFVFAEIIANYYKEKGESDLRKALDYYICKYINDISGYIPRTFHNELMSQSILMGLQIIALVRELDTNNDEKLLKFIHKNFKNYYPIFEVLTANNIDNSLNSDLLIQSRLGIFNIVPDPLADYFVIKLLNNNQRWIKKFIIELSRIIPLRVTTNLLNTISNVEKGIAFSPDAKGINIIDFVEEIWNDINTNIGDSPEYFDAIMFFTYQIGNDQISFKSELNLDIWQQTYKKLNEDNKTDFQITEKYAIGLANAVGSYDKIESAVSVERCLEKLKELNETSERPEITEKYAMGLVNALGRDKIENAVNVERCLEKLKELNEISDIPEITEDYAKGLFNAASGYSNVGDIVGMERCLEKLKELTERVDRPEITEKYAMILVNAENVYIGASDSVGIESYLEKLKKLNETSERPEITEQYIKGLSNAVIGYGMFNNIVGMESCLEKLKELNEISDIPEITEDYARGLVSAVKGYGDLGDTAGMESCLEKLRELTERPGSPKITEEYAHGLFNAVIAYGKAVNTTGMESCLEKLKGLNSISEQLRSVHFEDILFDVASRDGKANNIAGMESCLEELEKMMIEISEKYALALFIATSVYGEAEDFVGMESSLEKLKVLIETSDIPEIIKYYVSALLNYSIFNKEVSENYEIDLFNYRHFLPDLDNRDNLLQDIETEFCISIQNEILKLYEKNSTNVTSYLYCLKDKINKDSDLTLLTDNLIDFFQNKNPQIRGIIDEFIEESIE